MFGFDLMHYDGEDIRSLHLIERRLQVTDCYCALMCIACI